jgi:signal transduction histidine kinase
MVARRSNPEPASQLTPDELRRRLEACSREVDELRQRLASTEHEGLRFVTGAAHAVLNPLTIVHSYLELVLNDLPDGLSDEQLAFLRTAHDAAVRLRNLVRDVLELAALETGSIEIEREEIDVLGILREACRSAQPAADARNVTIETVLPKDAPWRLTGDQRRIADALGKLVDHSVRAAGDGGRVVVTAALQGRNMKISVRDTGPTVECEAAKHIFEPFAELPTSGQPRRPGLALAVARRQLEACGGKLTASTRTESGITFTAVLTVDHPGGRG